MLLSFGFLCFLMTVEPCVLPMAIFLFILRSNLRVDLQKSISLNQHSFNHTRLPSTRAITSR